MKEFFRKNHRIIFYSSWLLLGLIQAYFTELEDDEAYYWVYSKFPAWGYFDHPPMIAMMIKAGYFFFKNELGVRLLSVLMSTASVFVIEKIIRPKNIFLFYAIVLSVAAFQLAGFMAVPDIPLIFFTAVFFLCYKKFVSSPSLYNSFVLGVVAALLLYSKYHGVLIIFFTLLSNLKLFKRYNIFVTGIVALIFYLPHLWWQYQHGFPSVQYHLFERNAGGYSFSFTTEYIIGQILLAGPIAGIILLPACFKYKPMNETEKALYFSMIGIYIFFLLSTLKARVEANWTAPVLIPLVILSHNFFNEKAKWRSVLIKTLPLTLLIVLFARMIMIFDFVPIDAVKERYHAWSGWPQLMKEKTKGLPVVFNNSYQRASKYWFYTGQTTYSLNEYLDRRNNYNFWPLEDSFLGKPVYVLDIHRLYNFTNSMKTSIGWVGYRYEPAFYSFAKIKIDVTPKRIIVPKNQPIVLHCKYEIPENYSSLIHSKTSLIDSTRIGIFAGQDSVKTILTSLSLKEMNEKRQTDVQIDPELPKGKYFLLFAINAGKNLATHNSERISLIVK